MDILNGLYQVILGLLANSIDNIYNIGICDLYHMLKLVNIQLIIIIINVEKIS